MPTWRPRCRTATDTLLLKAGPLQDGHSRLCASLGLCSVQSYPVFLSSQTSVAAILSPDLSGQQLTRCQLNLREL